MSYFAGNPNGYLPHPPQAHPFSGPASETSDVGMTGDPQFDIFEWHPAYQSCQRYFLDHAQHDGSVQAVAALVNIALPFQWIENPIFSTAGPQAGGPGYGMPYRPHGPISPRHSVWISLVPYIRRLVVTGFDSQGILHGFFGDDWRKGIGPVQECERRNYLFAAKSVPWAEVKRQYDMSPRESVPFLKPLQNVQLAEIEGGEKTWSQWLAMSDWMVGPRAPDPDDPDTERRRGSEER